MKGFIFDVDGTLLDSMHVWEHLGDELLNSYQIQARENLDERYATLSLQEALQDLHLRYLPQLDMQELAQGLSSLIKQRYATLHLKPGALSFVKKIHRLKLPMAIVSAGEKAVTMPILERCGIIPYMQFYMGCEEAGGNKHQPDIFLQAAHKLGCKPEDVIVIEDAYHAMKAAKLAGMKVWAIEEARQMHALEQIKATADIYVHSFHEMEELICIK